jgi:hypothetical protein
MLLRCLRLRGSGETTSRYAARNSVIDLTMVPNLSLRTVADGIQPRFRVDQLGAKTAAQHPIVPLGWFFYGVISDDRRGHAYQHKTVTSENPSPIALEGGRGSSCHAVPSVRCMIPGWTI